MGIAFDSQSANRLSPPAASNAPYPSTSTLHVEGLTTATETLHIGVVEVEARLELGLGEVQGRALEEGDVKGMDEHPRSTVLDHEILVFGLNLEIQQVGVARAAPILESHSQPAELVGMGLDDLPDPGCSSFTDADHGNRVSDALP